MAGTGHYRKGAGGTNFIDIAAGSVGDVKVTGGIHS
jgi:hypothetical protein